MQNSNFYAYFHEIYKVEIKGIIMAISKMITKGLIFIIGVLLGTGIKAQDIRINELMASNTGLILDEDGDTPDWIELNNFGESPVNLMGYYLSDDLEDLLKWPIPAIDCVPGEPILIFASGKDRQQMPLNWYTMVDRGDEWRYIVPDGTESENWRNIEFDDAGWNAGGTSIGYSDGDDATYVPNGTISVFMRKRFTLETIDGLEALWFHMDYDDSFVAYLNGLEIARANIGTPGLEVTYNQTALTDHEAAIYNGGAPDAFDLSGLINLLVEGENVLAVQVHNLSAGSSDMTGIPFLTLGYSQTVPLNAPLSDDINLGNLLPHTNFKLSSAGETVYLTHEMGGIVDSLAFPTIPGNYSYGIPLSNPLDRVIFVLPTPGYPNAGPFFEGVVTGEVQFSIDQMFLSATQQLALSGAGEEEVIRYTQDGSDPVATSPVYQQPIVLSSNRVVRARIFRDDYLPGKIGTKTYLFENSHGLPVVSVTTDPDNLWDNDTGIYVLGDNYENAFPFFGANFWQDWERPANIELMEPWGETVFSANCGIKIFGGWSRGHEQKSLSVFFRSSYGDPILEYEMFDSKPIDQFHSLVLRNSGNDWNTSMMRDGMMTSLMRNLDIDLQAYRPAVLYLNGQYWGIQNIREKTNEDFLEANHGIPSESIELLETNAQSVEGSNADYLEMINFLETSDITLSENYDLMSDRMDISNFTDYVIAQIYIDNQDWPGNNIKFWRPQEEGGKWRWILFDTDFGFSIWSDNNYLNNTLAFATHTNGPPWPNPPWSTFLFRKLLKNLEFRNYFINRFADLMNTTFKPLAVKNHIDDIAEEIDGEMSRHFNRWAGSNIWAWDSEVAKMKSYADARVYYVRNHIRSKFFLPGQHSVSLAKFPEQGGSIGLNSLTLHETPWAGIYFESVPIKLTALPQPGYVFDRWEVNGEVLTEETIEIDITQGSTINLYFVEGNAATSVVINEINYNSPSNADAGDWVELLNPTSGPIDMSDWILKDEEDIHEFIIPEGTILEPQGYLVLCRSNNKFSEIHPDVWPYLGEFDFGLSSSGDMVRLYNASGELVDSVAYGVSTPWPVQPNGSGPSLELIYFNFDNTLPESWQASSGFTGTPGAPNSSLTPTENLPIEDGLAIFPNPFEDFVMISPKISVTGPWKLSIFTADGRLCFETISDDAEYRWNGKDSSGNHLPTGVYGLKVETGNGVFVGRVVLGR
ncbi:MAG: T9SS C-terminal target domain-containing protein [Bacteroidetes bacterium]|nr:MAG: T9SS C-terminal target domain-containing protein [Bacteroidota bacterium]